MGDQLWSDMCNVLCCCVSVNTLKPRDPHSGRMERKKKITTQKEEEEEQRDSGTSLEETL